MVRYSPQSNGDYFVFSETGNYIGELCKNAHKQYKRYAYFPQALNSYVTSELLRDIADKLDELNKGL